MSARTMSYAEPSPKKQCLRNIPLRLTLLPRWPLSKIPAPLSTEKKLYLSAPPKRDHRDFSWKLDEHSLITREFPSGTAPEKIVDIKIVRDHIIVSDCNANPDDYKSLSNTWIVGIDPITKKVLFLIFVFGRSNGPSNFAETTEIIRKGDGDCEEKIISLPVEKLFQACKAHYTYNKPDEDDYNTLMDKLEEIFEAKNAKEAKNISRTINMSEEQVESWKTDAKNQLWRSMQFRLVDPAFRSWFVSIDKFIEEHELPRSRLLFLEIGDPKETQYTCGKMGPEIVTMFEPPKHTTIDADWVLARFNHLRDEFGPDSKDKNFTGRLMNHLFHEFRYQAASDITEEGWAQMYGVRSIFDVDF